jgi:hypothetical protein
MKSKEDNINFPTQAQVETYQMLAPLLLSIVEEMKEFSKKKPDEPLNKFKVKLINRALTPIKQILSSEPTDAFLDLLDEDSLPSNSDVVLIVGQFQAAMARFKTKFNRYANGSYHWVTKENPHLPGRQ